MAIFYGMDTTKFAPLNSLFSSFFYKKKTFVCKQSDQKKHYGPFHFVIYGHYMHA